MSNIHISINPKRLSYMEELLELEEYTSKSEIINVALLKMQENDILYQNYKSNIAKLKQELQLGEESGFDNTDLQEIYTKAKQKVSNNKY